MTCLTEDALIQAALEPTTLDVATRIHVEQCERCQTAIAKIESLGRAIATPTHSSLSVEQLVNRATVESGPPRWVMALAASLILLTSATLMLRSTEQVTARGSTLAWRDRVSAKMAVAREGILEANTHHPSNALFTSSVFGLAPGDSLFLASFIVDSKREVHWVTPAWVAGTPEAFALPSDAGAVLTLPTSVQFDDLAPGHGLAVTMITARPVTVTEVEALPVIDEASLRGAFGEAVIRIAPYEIDQRP